MPPLQLRRPNKNIMTAMSFEVHLWWGIDINENLKMTDIWNIFFSDILSGAIMIRSSSQCHTINTWHRDICELPNVLRKENKHCLKRFEQWIFLLLHVFKSYLHPFTWLWKDGRGTIQGLPSKNKENCYSMTQDVFAGNSLQWKLTLPQSALQADVCGKCTDQTLLKFQPWKALPGMLDCFFVA